MFLQVILVNTHDQEIGVMEKLEAHQKGLLHRAFSIFIFNTKGEMLLQKRAKTKYHSPNLWSNACCSHPQPNENIFVNAQLRLQQEMGFVTPLHFAFSFIYKTEMENGLIENEFDHVYYGIYDGEIQPNTTEVSDYCFKKIEDIENEIREFPNRYTSWFCIALPLVKNFIQKNNESDKN